MVATTDWIEYQIKFNYFCDFEQVENAEHYLLKSAKAVLFPEKLMKEICLKSEGTHLTLDMFLEEKETDEERKCSLQYLICLLAARHLQILYKKFLKLNKKVLIIYSLDLMLLLKLL